MSAVTITITLPPESQAMIEHFKQMPLELPRAIKRGMDRALPIVAGRIVERRLSGKGPFPPIQHQLGEVTGRLRRSVRAEPAVISGDTVTGAIGSNVVYASVHEFGWSGYPSFKSGVRHLRTFAERAPFRTGINENAEYIAGEIETEIMAEMKK
jgi:hypothetical protein